MQICYENKCTGCGACANLCPVGCIEMKENVYGELHPVIDERKCIECKKCQRFCPSNSVINFNKVIGVYAAWRKDKRKQLDSASGGIGAVLAENWIKEGGVVYGTKYVSHFSPKIVGADSLAGIQGFKGSKYIQSNTNMSFTETNKLLKEGRKVLFVGTPCQLAGLYTICNRDNPNLLTVEILCHGVSPEKYFQEELKYIESQYNIKEYDNVTFRTNRWMMDFYFGIWKNNKILFSQEAYENHYFRGFLTGLTLRESCYSCQYKKPERIGDIIIGDFIGFGVHVPYEGKKEKTSLILTTTEKGYTYLQKCENNLVMIERSLEEAMIDGRSLKEPFPRHRKQKEFRKEYLKKGFIKAVDSTVTDEIIQSKKNNRVLHIKRRIKFFLNNFFNIRIQNGKIYYEE